MTSTLESPARPRRRDRVREVRVAIIGSGFAGLGMAIALRRRGEHDFVVLERADDVGGTWRDNTYPGAACDVQSNLYSFSFAPNPDWPRSYSEQPEIQAYLQARRRRASASASTASSAPTSPARAGTTPRGAGRSRRRPASSAPDVLVSAAGALADPTYPDIPGLDSFAGTVMHSARWDARARPRRRAGRRHRHRRLGHPGRARRSSRSSTASRSTSARRPGSCPAPTTR